MYRKINEWEWYKEIPVKVLFIHLLTKVNFTEKKWQGRDIKKWEIITSLDRLAHETGLTVMQVRTAIKKLKSTNEITSHSTSTFTHIQLVKWEQYQSSITSDITNEQQTDNKPITTTKEGNKEKKGIIDTGKDDVYMQAWHLSITHEEFSKLEKEYWGEKADEVVQGILNYRKNTKYKSLYLTALTWLKREQKKTDEPIKKVHVTTDYSKL